MRKIINFILKNMIGFTLGVSLSVILAVYAATQIPSAQVKYNDTTVYAALDELYTLASNSGVPIDPDTFNTNTKKTVYASSKGLCIKRNNKLNCFKVNNFAEEQNHIQQVFSDISCNVDSSGVLCSASDFDCLVDSYGGVGCGDQSDSSFCSVSAGGSVYC